MTRISPPFLRFSAELCCCFQSLCGQNFEGNTVLHLRLLFCAQSSSSRREESNSKANFHRWFQAQQREGGKAINSNPAIILSAIFYGFFFLSLVSAMKQQHSMHLLGVYGRKKLGVLFQLKLTKVAIDNFVSALWKRSSKTILSAAPDIRSTSGLPLCVCVCL